jgi:hypothetical protein
MGCPMVRRPGIQIQLWLQVSFIFHAKVRVHFSALGSTGIFLMNARTVLCILMFPDPERAQLLQKRENERLGCVLFKVFPLSLVLCDA